MPFQKTMGEPAPGVIGGRVTLNPEVIQVKIAASDVTVGGMVWLDPATDQVAASGTGHPYGLVRNTGTDAEINIGEEASLVIKAGRPVTVVIRGDGFVLADVDASIGQAVYANLTTGAVSIADSGSAVAGRVETSWQVTTARPAGTPCEVDNRRADNE